MYIVNIYYLNSIICKISGDDIMKIKKAKIIKVLMFSSMIATTFASGAAIASCGKKNPGSNSNSWDHFKKLALNESAAHLHDSITIEQLKVFHWSSEDVATWGANEQPTVVSGKQEITATIIIQGADKYQNFPINFDITYDPTGYDYKAWTYTQNPNVVSWDDFKNLAGNVSPNDLLAIAKLSPGYKDTFKWEYGTDNQRVWVDGDIAQWDVYGGADDQDPAGGINLMNGEIDVDNQDQTITAIISKVGHEGIYDADPIKAVIKYQESAKIYNSKNWKFSPVKQLQSQTKYKALFAAEFKIIKNINTRQNPDLGLTLWIDFSKRNWVYPIHDVNVKQYLESEWPKFGKDGNGYNMENANSIFEPSRDDDGNLDKKGFASQIEIDTYYKSFKDYRTSSFIDPNPFVMTSKFLFVDPSNQNIGTCFNYVWSEALLKE